MNKNILILGGNGYIGSRLYEYLKTNFKVSNVDLCWFGKIFEETTVKDYRNLSISFLEKFSHVILLAGHSNSAMCMESSVPCFKNNILNFCDLVEKINSTQTLIYASSAAVYGNNPNLTDEYTPLAEAQNFYDYSKICIENISNLYPNKNLIGLRFGSVSGFSKNMREENLLNSITFSSLEKGEIIISNPDLIRSVLGINDLCRAVETLICSNSIKGKIYNLTSVNKKIIDFGKIIQKKTNSKLTINDTFKTSYSFNCSNLKFKHDFNFNFLDTIDSMHEELVENYNNILFREPRKNNFYISNEL